MDISPLKIAKLILGLGLFASLRAPAQTTTTGMTLVGTPAGLSFYDPGITTEITTTLPTIFGGYAGAAGGCASPISTSTCDSCAGGATLAACNPTSVHPNLVLQVTMQSSTATLFQGNPQVRWMFSGETTARLVDNTPSLAAGQPFTAEIKWSKLCEAAGGNSACTTDTGSLKTLYIGISNDNNDTSLEEKVDFSFAFRYVDATKSEIPAPALCPVGVAPTDSTVGVCDYTVAPGDEKIYISDYAASSNDLTTSNSAVKYNRIAMFYQENATDASTVTTSSPQITLTLSNNSPSEPSISDQRVRGLTNNTNYCFALGNMDQAGNITYFPPASVLTNASKVCARPSEVVGLLDDKRCFIATATFGSNLAPEVETFRQFRNQFLLPNAAGKAFVRAYYKFGPEAAEWVSQSKLLRILSLAILWPLLLFVKLSLFLGLWPAILIALVTVFVLKKSSSLLGPRPLGLKEDV